MTGQREIIIMAHDRLTVILATALGDWHDHRLMVCGREHGADTVVTGRQTTSDGGREKAVVIASIIDSLEEDKGRGVRRLVRSEVAAQGLNGDMSVTDDAALTIEVLGGRVIGTLRIGEGSRSEVVNLDLDVEVGVGLKVVVVGGVDQNAGDHVVLGWDLAHRDSVARAAGLLLTVGQLLSLAEVDEVGVVRGGSNGAISRLASLV